MLAWPPPRLPGTDPRSGTEDIRDPLGDPLDGYREVADELLDLSVRLAAALTEERV